MVTKNRIKAFLKIEHDSDAKRLTWSYSSETIISSNLPLSFNFHVLISLPLLYSMRNAFSNS